jgi:class 3 adenylate cyclase
MEASRLGKILSEQTTRRVIVGVLVMLFSVPQLEVGTTNQTPLFGLEQLFWLGQSSCSNVTRFRDAAQRTNGELKCDQDEAWVSSEGWNFMVFEYSEQSRYNPSNFQKGLVHANPLLYLEIPHFQYKGRIAPVTSVRTKRCTRPDEVEHGFSVPEGGLPELNQGLCGGASSAGECCWQHVPSCAPDNDECPWRAGEMEDFVYTPPACRHGHSACAGLSVRAVFLKRQQSETEAAYSMLTTTFIVFLLGIGAMVFSTDTQNLVIAPIEKMVMIVKQLADDPLAKPDIEEDCELVDAPATKKRDGQIETSMLENTILKIGALLQVGFGEAGARIIGKNMNLGGGELQIMVPGRKIFAVFGYCNICDFMETTDCLQEEVMVFVNKIARVVHTCVHEWSGAVSKNIGESFLVTWTTEEFTFAKILEDGYGMRDGTDQNEAIGELADKALVSFIKIISEVRRASDLAAYARHPKIIPKFGMDYKVGMNFTLHCGWAIEAAIGSMHKVDASYLSPHASFCSRLQDATIEYGVDILFTEAVHGFLSNRAKDRCRKVDQVKVEGFEKPMGLFTFDVNQAVVTAPEGHFMGQMIPPAEISSESLSARGIDWMFVMDQDIVQLQDGISLEFQSAWRQAFQWYTNGAWARSMEALQRCCQILSTEDGPSGTLARYMTSMDLEPPEDWTGYRVLELGAAS